MDVQNAHYINDCVTSLIYPEICILVIYSGSHCQECAGNLDCSTQLPQRMNMCLCSSPATCSLTLSSISARLPSRLALWLEKILIRPWYSWTNILGQASTMCTRELQCFKLNGNHTENDRYWQKNNFLLLAKCLKMYSLFRICILRIQKVL